MTGDTTPANQAADSARIQSPPPHITVCVCTYRRPELLTRCLRSLQSLETRDRFTFSVVVVDNDSLESARAAALDVADHSNLSVEYVVEGRQGISHARNKAVEQSRGKFLAFLDDDEFPVPQWLLLLVETYEANRVDGVLGPVNPHFDSGAPRWIIDGKFYDRPPHPTGMELTWRRCRTGNVLLNRELFRGDTQPFDPACLSGEDQDFFRRKIEAGHKFVWCNEAQVYEVVPPVRWKRAFLIRRALFRGVFAQKNHGLQPVRLAQAAISVPVYLVLRPLSFLFGQAQFMTCAFKLSYYFGRLLGAVGINPIQSAYVID